MLVPSLRTPPLTCALTVSQPAGAHRRLVAGGDRGAQARPLATGGGVVAPAPARELAPEAPVPTRHLDRIPDPLASGGCFESDRTRSTRVCPEKNRATTFRRLAAIRRRRAHVVDPADRGAQRGARGPAAARGKPHRPSTAAIRSVDRRPRRARRAQRTVPLSRSIAAAPSSSEIDCARRVPTLRQVVRVPSGSARQPRAATISSSAASSVLR